MANENEMVVLRCKGCGAFYIPPKFVCSKCDETSLEDYPISGSGRVYTFTTIFVAPEQFKSQTPYDIAIIQLENGLKVTSRVDRPDQYSLHIGDAVHYVKKDEVGYWFSPLTKLTKS
jgi:uncharacterized OB-fold protein